MSRFNGEKFESRRFNGEMSFSKQRTVRFYDERQRLTVPTTQVSRPGIPTSIKPLNHKGQPDNFPWHKRIFDPTSDFVLRWNRVFLFCCISALFIDPLYFYVPAINYDDENGTACVKSDTQLSVALTCLRTLCDLLYVINIIIKFRTAYVDPSSTMRVFGGGELIRDSKKISLRYLKSDLAIDVVAALPLPQVLGSLWYLLTVDRQTTCWKEKCTQTQSIQPSCNIKYLDCSFSRDEGYENWINSTQVFQNCNVSNTNSTFNFGMFIPALNYESPAKGFIVKYLYSFWWGLQNLSCYSQTLTVSTYIGETLYAIILAVVGLVLFALLIGNVQTYMLSVTMRVEEWRLKQRDTEEWMKHRQLPQELQDRVRRFVQYKWLATRGVDEESVLETLPADLRRDIKRHLCLDLVCRVPLFAQMDEQLLNAICERLVSSLCTEGTYVVREGDPVTEMLFVIRGKLESSTTNGGRTGFFNSTILKPGDFCGEELLGWALVSKCTINLPSSTHTVKALVEVEAFTLSAEDLKFVANQFRRLHSKKLQHSFRFYSHHWRTWATYFIQMAWRRYKRRKMAKDLSTRESSSFNSVRSEEEEEEEENAGPSWGKQNFQNIGFKIVALKMKDSELCKLQKPEEPDFSVDGFE
ncbi:cyclic nucleotide-gated ion channel 17-like isoform X2 [Carex rostrata]